MDLVLEAGMGVNSHLCPNKTPVSDWGWIRKNLYRVPVGCGWSCLQARIWENQELS